ncbi:CHAP domain-containing protein [Mycobacterium sp. UM_Kg1]|uniref:CHAP domain-containing protein n=1 Tax=Mycobacterium sp. UM_Kg1 TaxID=1545691 RepID=UPI00061ACDE9|nr:CHAP domain-containing protein [Mycobacterium sp. UM_Kg1]
MAIRFGVGGCAALAIGLSALAQAPAVLADPVLDVSSAQALDIAPEAALPAMPPRAAQELDVFRRAAADAGLGHPVMYGDGQCYPLVQEYIHAVGSSWRNRDPSGNAFDLYEHFPTNGLAQFFDQVPFAGGLNAPQVGDIVVYGPGGYVSEHGHAAVVTDVRGSGPLLSYEAAEQNSGGRLFVTLNWRDYNPLYNTLGYLRPKL